MRTGIATSPSKISSGLPRRPAIEPNWATADSGIGPDYRAASGTQVGISAVVEVTPASLALDTGCAPPLQCERTDHARESTVRGKVFAVGRLLLQRLGVVEWQNRYVGDDEQFLEILAMVPEQLDQILVGPSVGAKSDHGFKRRTDRTRLAHRLQQFERFVAHRQQAIPSRRQRRIYPFAMRRLKLEQMDALAFARRYMRVNLVRGEGNQRREHPHDRVQQVEQRRLRGAPLKRRAPGAIKPVTRHVDIQRAEIDDDEIQDRVIGGLVIEVLVCAPNLALEPFEPGEDEAIELEHLRVLDRVARRI